MNNKFGKVTLFTFKQVITAKWFCMITILGLVSEFLATQTDKIIKLTTGAEIDAAAVAADPSGSQFYLSFAIVMTLFLLILIYGANISNSVVEEKSARIIETLLCYVKPVDLLSGKIFGYVLGIIAQIAIWIGYGVVLQKTIGFPEILAASGFNMSIQLVLLICGSIIFGFVMYAAAFVALASFADNAQDSTQLMLPVGIVIMAAYFLSITAINTDGSSAITALSYAPFFSPIMSFTRLDLLGLSWWEAILNLAVQAIETVMVILICGHVYRYGVVRYGMRKISFRKARS